MLKRLSYLTILLVIAGFAGLQWLTAEHLRQSRDGWRAHTRLLTDAALTACLQREELISSAEVNGWEVDDDRLLLRSTPPDGSTNFIVIFTEPAIGFLENVNKDFGEVFHFDEDGCWIM